MNAIDPLVLTPQLRRNGRHFSGLLLQLGQLATSYFKSSNWCSYWLCNSVENWWIVFGPSIQKKRKAFLGLLSHLFGQLLLPSSLANLQIDCLCSLCNMSYIENWWKVSNPSVQEERKGLFRITTATWTATSFVKSPN